MTQETLARRMFLILHDPFTGKPGVGIEPMKYGLVTAALAHLVMQQRLGLAEGRRVVVVDPRGNGTDDVSAFIVGSIQGSPAAGITRSWVESLTDIVYELVARALMAEGVVRREHGGRRLVRRNPDRFPAVDLLRAAGPRIRLEHMLRSPHEMDVAGAVLAGIVHVFHMDRVLDVDRDRAVVRSSLSAAADHLPADLRSLVDGVASAVSAISLDFRRL
jgi:hypothetical protein